MNASCIKDTSVGSTLGFFERAGLPAIFNLNAKDIPPLDCRAKIK